MGKHRFERKIIAERKQAFSRAYGRMLLHASKQEGHPPGPPMEKVKELIVTPKEALRIIWGDMIVTAAVPAEMFIIYGEHAGNGGYRFLGIPKKEAQPYVDYITNKRNETHADGAGAPGAEGDLGPAAEDATAADRDSAAKTEAESDGPGSVDGRDVHAPEGVLAGPGVGGAARAEVPEIGREEERPLRAHKSRDGRDPGGSA